MAHGGHLEFRKITIICAVDKDSCTKCGGKIYHGSGRGTVTKHVNRKFIRVMSSNELQKQKSVDRREHKSYLKKSWYRAQSPATINAKLEIIHITWKSKMAVAAILNYGKCQYLISWLYKDICIKFGGRMHHSHTEITTWPTITRNSAIAKRSRVSCAHKITTVLRNMSKDQHMQIPGRLFLLCLALQIISECYVVCYAIEISFPSVCLSVGLWRAWSVSKQRTFYRVYWHHHVGQRSGSIVKYSAKYSQPFSPGWGLFCSRAYEKNRDFRPI